MNYMDALTGHTRTQTPVVKRAPITDSRSALSAAQTVAAQDYVPSREVLDAFRQDRYGK